MRIFTRVSDRGFRSNIILEEETVRENTEECRLREKIRSLEIEMKELIELHSLEFQVIKEQLKEEEQQRKSRQRNHVIKMHVT